MRPGVAPDHPEDKSVTADFTAVAEDPRVNFIGGVWVGKAGESVVGDNEGTSAGAIMMVAPVLIFFFSLQRQFIEGLTQGGLKA